MKRIDLLPHLLSFYLFLLNYLIKIIQPIPFLLNVSLIEFILFFLSILFFFFFLDIKDFRFLIFHRLYPLLNVFEVKGVSFDVFSRDGFRCCRVDELVLRGTCFNVRVARGFLLVSGDLLDLDFLWRLVRFLDSGLRYFWVDYFWSILVSSGLGSGFVWVLIIFDCSHISRQDGSYKAES